MNIEIISLHPIFRRKNGDQAATSKIRLHDFGGNDVLGIYVYKTRGAWYVRLPTRKVKDDDRIDQYPILYFHDRGKNRLPIEAIRRAVAPFVEAQSELVFLMKQFPPATLCSSHDQPPLLERETQRGRSSYCPSKRRVHTQNNQGGYQNGK